MADKKSKAMTVKRVLTKKEQEEIKKKVGVPQSAGGRGSIFHAGLEIRGNVL